MATFYSPRIVTDGLVLHLDAGNNRSFVSGSTTWYDLSGNGKSGSLTNGPTYNSANGGSVSFDGTDDYAAIQGNTFGYSPGTTGELSLEVWVYPTGPFTSYTNEPPTTNLAGIFGQGYFANTAGWGLGVTVQSGTENCFSFQVRNFSNIVNVGAIGSPRAIFTNNSWYHVVGTFKRNDFSRIYMNGVLSASTSSAALNGVNINPSTNNAEIARGGGTFLFGGRYASVRLYSRALSDNEIRQNYNATKGRFGLL